MKRIYVILTICSLALGSMAQTQQGVVKTRGKMVNGKLVPGVGLSGATITIQGRSAVLSQASGTFSFPVTNKTFFVQSVQKMGYQLVDAEAAKKVYQYSPNTFYLVMEKPDQQAEDKLAAERKIRRTLQQQLQLREDELEELKEQNKLTQEEYRKRFEQLYNDQQNNEKLIADMAKKYAALDYDQMDDLNQRISDAILNGRLTEADSLLRSKGDIRSRDAEISRRQQAETQRKAEIAKEQSDLKASEAGTRKLLEDFGADCYRYHNLFKLENKYDSAAYYIELRANRDTTNVEWQFEAGLYFKKQKQYKKAIAYFEKVLDISRHLAAANPQLSEIYIASTASALNNLAAMYMDVQRFDESETMFKEALDITRSLTQENPLVYEQDLATALNNLAILYMYTHRFEESEAMYKEALIINRRLAQQSILIYKSDLASTLNNLASLYNEAQRFKESEAMLKEALEIHRFLVQENPQEYEAGLAKTLNNLAILYSDTRRLEESESILKEGLEIYRRFAAVNPQAYESEVSFTLGNLSFIVLFLKNFADAEKYAYEGIAVDSTQHWISGNLAAALLFQGRYAEAEIIYRQYKDELKDEFLDDFRQFAEAGVIPKEREDDVEKIKQILNE